MSALLARVVEVCRRNALVVALLVAALAALAGFYTVRHVAIDTDTDKLISSGVAWRKREADFNRDFPQDDNLLAVVVDGSSPDQAGDAADALAAGLQARPNLFSSVREPGGGRFFRTHGLLFLSRDEVQKFADDMITAQPLLGTVAADPSLRGVFNAIDLLTQGALRGEIPAAQLDSVFTALARATEAANSGRAAPLSWQTLLSNGRTPPKRELRRFVLAQPVLDYGAVEPSHRAVEAVHSIAKAGELDAAHGVRVRVTGSAALSDDQLSALSDGAGWTAALSLGLLCFWLILGLRSLRTVVAVLATLLAGLIFCAAFAVRACGPFNPISLAFAPLFIGIAIDFGIQFSVRHLAERRRFAAEAEALDATARGVGPPLLVAAVATAVGFLAFVPTDYAGVSSLGLIAGVGMGIAFILNVTFLPALLALLRPPGREEAAGFGWAGPLDRLIARRRAWFVGAAAALALASAAAMPRLHFDFNPIHLQNPNSESVATLFDLMGDPETTPYTAKLLAATPAAAADLVAKLKALPEVSQVLSVGSFVPEDQPAKLAILEDARSLLEPTLSPPAIKPPPTLDEQKQAVTRCSADLRVLGGRGDRAAQQLAADLDSAVARQAAAFPALETSLVAPLERRLADMRLALEADSVTEASLPPEVTADWIGRDGRYRVEAYPSGDARDNSVLRAFTAAVLRVAPAATGTPVTIQESARTVTHAFATAGFIALAAITLLLGAVLRRTRDVALVLAPLLLAGLLALATGVAAGFALNFANIITLPLLLGIGVAFNIYFVMRWRGGEDRPLQSATARGILFSALTTGTAFGSLALSRSPGMAEMGKLLSLALGCTLLCTRFVLPALLGPPPGPGRSKGDPVP